MPRRGQHLEVHLAHVEPEAVAHFHPLKARSTMLPDVDSRARALSQLAKSRNEVGMQMGFENVANSDTLFLGSLKINLHIALRIDHHGLALGCQHVGSMRQTAQIELLKVHWESSPATGLW